MGKGGEVMEYSSSGIRRLMAALMLRAVRDVFSQDVVVREDAKRWLSKYGIKHINQYGLKISVLKFNHWVQSDFTEGVVQMDALGNPVMRTVKGNDVEEF
jgi:hypothetical protein